MTQTVKSIPQASQTCEDKLISLVQLYVNDASSARESDLKHQEEQQNNQNVGAAKSALTRSHKRAERYNDESTRQKNTANT